MNYFCVVTASAAVLMFSACGKVEPQLKNSGPTAQVVSVLPAPVQSKSTPKTYDGPFGLAMGIQIKELEDLGFKRESETLYTGTPPKPASSFEQYYVSVSPSAGVCQIAATHDVKNVSGSGAQLKSATDSVAEALEVKYGKPTKKYDFAAQDVYRRNPQFWMMALIKGDVTYAYEWTKGKSFDPPNDITHIDLMARSSSINDGFVRLMYTFSNDRACEEEVKRKKSSNL